MQVEMISDNFPFPSHPSDGVNQRNLLNGPVVRYVVALGETRNAAGGERMLFRTSFRFQPMRLGRSMMNWGNSRNR